MGSILPYFLPPHEASLQDAIHFGGSVSRGFSPGWYEASLQDAGHSGAVGQVECAL